MQVRAVQNCDYRPPRSTTTRTYHTPAAGVVVVPSRTPLLDVSNSFSIPPAQPSSIKPFGVRSSAKLRKIADIQNCPKDLDSVPWWPPSASVSPIARAINLCLGEDGAVPDSPDFLSAVLEGKQNLEHVRVASASWKDAQEAKLFMVANNSPSILVVWPQPVMRTLVIWAMQSNWLAKVDPISTASAAGRMAISSRTIDAELASRNAKMYALLRHTEVTAPPSTLPSPSPVLLSLPPSALATPAPSTLLAPLLTPTVSAPSEGGAPTTACNSAASPPPPTTVPTAAHLVDSELNNPQPLAPTVPSTGQQRTLPRTLFHTPAAFSPATNQFASIMSRSTPATGDDTAPGGNGAPAGPLGHQQAPCPGGSDSDGPSDSDDSSSSSSGCDESDGEGSGSEQQDDSGSDDEPQPVPASAIPLCKPVGERQHNLGPALRLYPDVPEQIEIVHTLPASAGLRPQQMDPVAPPPGRAPPRRKGPAIAKTEGKVNMACGNKNCRPWRPRTKQNRLGNNWRAVPNHFRRNSHPKFVAFWDICQEMSKFREQRRVGQLPPGSKCCFTRCSTAVKEGIAMVKSVLVLLASAVHGAFQHKERFMEDLQQLVAKYTTFQNHRPCAEAIEEALALAMSLELFDVQGQNVVLRINHDAPGSHKWHRQFFFNYMSKLCSPPVVVRYLMTSLGMTMDQFDGLRRVFTITNPEDGATLSGISYNRSYLTTEKDLTVAKAAQYGYDVVRGQGSYTLVAPSVEGTAGVLVKGALRSDPAFAAKVNCEPERLSTAAKKADADCEVDLTFVVGVDASNWSRAHEQLTFAYLGCIGHMRMLPAGVTIGNDKQDTLTVAFASPFEPGQLSLFKQMEGLLGKPFCVLLEDEHFNYRKLYIKPRIVLVPDSPASIAISGLEKEGFSCKGEQFTPFVPHSRGDMQQVLRVVPCDEDGQSIGFLGGPICNKYQEGCDCRRCSFTAKSSEGLHGGHDLEQGMLTIETLAKMMHMPVDLIYKLNELNADEVSPDTPLHELPESYKCPLVDEQRVQTARYPRGSVLAQMQDMMVSNKGRVLVVLDLPMFGRSQGYPSALCFGDKLITVMYPAIMHLFKCNYKRWLKITIYIAYDNDQRDGGSRVKDIQAIFLELGMQLVLLEGQLSKDKSPKLRFNQDFGPLQRVVKGAGARLVKVAFRDSASSGQQQSLDDLNIFAMGRLSAGKDRGELWEEQRENLVGLCDLVKKEGCYTEAQKVQALELAATTVASFMAAGVPRKQLSNYYLLLRLMGHWQPPQDVAYLLSGQFGLTPADWDPLCRPAACLKEVNDEETENMHRVGKLHKTNNGGGRWKQANNTISSDTVKRDICGARQVFERYQTLAVEKIERAATPAGPVRRLFLKNKAVQWNGEETTALHVLEAYHDMGLEYRSLDEGGFTDADWEQLEKCCKVVGLSEKAVVQWLKNKKWKSMREAPAAGARTLLAKRLDTAELELLRELHQQAARARQRPLSSRTTKTAPTRQARPNPFVLAAASDVRTGASRPPPGRAAASSSAQVSAASMASTSAAQGAPAGRPASSRKRAPQDPLQQARRTAARVRRSSADAMSAATAADRHGAELDMDDVL